MNESGTLRTVDELGRVVLPCGLRKAMNINSRARVKVYAEADKIIIMKHEPTCTFTSKPDDLIDYMGRKVSLKAIKEMAAKAGLI